jgi:hypothetical protein
MFPIGTLPGQLSSDPGRRYDPRSHWATPRAGPDHRGRLFPSTCTDAFGPAYATTNARLLYTAQGTSAFLVPLANVLQSATGSREPVVPVAAITNVVVVLLALFVLRPMRANRVRRARMATAPHG